MNIEVIAPILTGVIILVTLRGQRMQMANAFRDVHRQARARARLMQINFKRNQDGTLLRSRDESSDAVYLTVTIENSSPDAVSDLALSAIWTMQEHGDSLTALVATLSVLKSEEISRSYLTAPIGSAVSGRPVAITITWTDASGVRWLSSREATDMNRSGVVLEQRHELKAISGLTGRGPQQLRWWHYARNAVLPYDYWIPSIEPQDGLNPAEVTRAQRWLIRRIGKGGQLQDKLLRAALNTRIARLGGNVRD